MIDFYEKITIFTNPSWCLIKMAHLDFLLGRLSVNQTLMKILVFISGQIFEKFKCMYMCMYVYILLLFIGAPRGGGTRGTSPPPEIEKIVVEK